MTEILFISTLFTPFTKASLLSIKINVIDIAKKKSSDLYRNSIQMNHIFKNYIICIKYKYKKIKPFIVFHFQYKFFL